MEEIEDKITLLLEEREKLLKDRESNRMQISICEQEIFMYAHLYDTLSGLMIIKRKNIEGYLTLLDYKRNNTPFVWPGLTSGYSHILPMIDQLQEEYDDLSSRAEKYKEIIKLYTNKKEVLDLSNEEIEDRIREIENELDIKPSFVKKIEMGE